MMKSIDRRQDPTTTAAGTTQTSGPTSQSQSPEETTPRTSNSPSQTTPTAPSTQDSTPTSTRATPTTTNEPTTTRQTSTSIPPTTTSRAETSGLQTSTSSETSASSTNQSTTPSATTQSEVTSQSETSSTLSPATSSASPTVSSTPTSTPLSNISSTVSVTSNPSSSASETQTSSPTSISSLIDPSTSPTSTPIITTSVSGSDTSDSPTPTRTPTPTPTPTSSTTPVRESRSSDSASSTLTSVLITTVATVNGQPTTASCISLCLFILRTLQINFQLTTVVPTLASSPPGPSGLSARSSKIVGGVVGGTLALLGVLLALFYISRRRRKAAAVRDAPRLQAPRQMLDADDFDLAEPGPAPYAYGMVGAHVNPNASGSIFHEVLPGTSTQPSHSYSRSVVSENDPLLVHHMRGGSADVDSVATLSPRESTHFRASSTTGLLYDPNDPFGDHPPRSVGPSSSRSHPLAVAKALEARSRGSDQHVYPPSAYRGPTEPSDPSSTSSPVLVHQDAGRVDPPDSSAPPAYGNTPR